MRATYTTNRLKKKVQLTSSAVKSADPTYFSTQKKTLLVFSAPWCPACIRLKSETLNQPAIRKELNDVLVKQINIDLVEHEELSRSFNVKAIPTMILIDQNGAELFRWLDFQDAAEFKKEFAFAKKLKTNLEQTKSSAALGDQEAILRMAENAFNQMDWPEAVRWYALLSKPQDLQRRLYAEVAIAKDEYDTDSKKKPEYLSALLKASVLSVSKLDTLFWKVDYFEEAIEEESLKANATGAKTNASPQINSLRASVQAVIQDLEFLLKDRQQFKKELQISNLSGLYGFEELETLNVIARAQNILGDKSARQKVLDRMYAMASRKKKNFAQPGELIHTIYYISQAGRDDEAEKLIQKLIKTYPDTYVYYDRYAKFLLKQKRDEPALQQANEALKRMEGNEPQLTLVKVRALVALKRNDEALEVISNVMKVVNAHPEKYKRTKAAFEKLQSEAQQSLKKK